MDFSPLIDAATNFLLPYLQKGADALAGKAPEAVSALWGLVKGRFTSPAQQEAVAELEAAPASDLAQKDFKVQLEKALTKDPALVGEVERLLREGGVDFSGNTQQAKASGGSTVIQVQGSGNTVGR